MHPQRLKCVINGKHNIVPIQTLVSIAFFSFPFIYVYLILKPKVRKREEIINKESFFGGGRGGYFFHVCYSSFG